MSNAVVFWEMILQSLHLNGLSIWFLNSLFSHTVYEPVEKHCEVHCVLNLSMRQVIIFILCPLEHC